MVNALITLVKLNKYWNEQQKNQVLAWLDCAKDFGEQVDELATKNEQAKKIIEELSKSLFLAKGLIRDLCDDTVVFEESKERALYCFKQGHLDGYKQAEQFLKE